MSYTENVKKKFFKLSNVKTSLIDWRFQIHVVWQTKIKSVLTELK